MKQNIRTFVAVEIGDEVRSRALELIKTLQAAGADVKWVGPENLHLTLKFLGDVPLREVPEICDTVARALVGHGPFELATRGAGAFPNAAKPRTVWLGSAEGEEQMARLNESIEAAVERLGYRREARRYQSHLTIGRVRAGGPSLLALGELLQRYADFDAGTSRVREVVVFSSDLDREGPTYQVLSRAKLRR